MHLTRARNRSQRYFTDHCRVVNPSNAVDQYGNLSDVTDDHILYDGKCFVSPGNMWPFETGGDVIRQGRTDVQVYVPVGIEGMNSDCLVEYDNNTYEIIGFSPRYTAGAALNITARRVS